MPSRKRGWLPVSDKACPREGGGHAPTQKKGVFRSIDRNMPEPGDLMMDWVVAVPPSEAASGVMSRETEGAAYAAMEEHGCVLLRGVFSPVLIDAMHREFMAQLGGLTA